MTDPLGGLGPVYVAALGAYLRDGDEAALSRAYELGRTAMTEGMGVLDMAVLHQASLAVLVVSRSLAEQLQLTRAAEAFFTELLSPFEMSFRGYRAANEELQRLNESLRQQKVAVDIANQELEAFSYSVSHDLRTPLRSIHAFSQVLLEDCGPALGDEGRQHARRIHDAAQHMAQLIEDLLSLARVTRAEIHRVDVNLSTVARQIEQWLRINAPERDVELVVEDGIHAIGDASLLTVVLQNLLGNAWKFTAKQPHAEIRFGREDRDGKPTYFVRDNGAGFDMSAAPKLFTPFHRLHPRSEFDGTGIGLATVRRVIQRHDGSVWASGAVGAGATFYFTLGNGSPAR